MEPLTVLFLLLFFLFHLPVLPGLIWDSTDCRRKASKWEVGRMEEEKFAASGLSGRRDGGLPFLLCDRDSKRQ